MFEDRLLRILYVLDWIQSVAQMCFEFEPLTVFIFPMTVILEVLSCAMNPLAWNCNTRFCMIFYLLARIFARPTPDGRISFRGIFQISAFRAIVLFACWAYRFPDDSISQAFEFGKKGWEFLANLLRNRAIQPQNLPEPLPLRPPQQLQDPPELDPRLYNWYEEETLSSDSWDFSSPSPEKSESRDVKSINSGEARD